MTTKAKHKKISIIPIVLFLVFFGTIFVGAHHSHLRILKKSKGVKKVAICHVPPDNRNNFHTISINRNALHAHIDHGDIEGNCNDVCSTICSNFFSSTTASACMITDCLEGEGCLDQHPDNSLCDDDDDCTIDICDPLKGCLHELEHCCGTDPCCGSLDPCCGTNDPCCGCSLQCTDECTCNDYFELDPQGTCQIIETASSTLKVLDALAKSNPEELVNLFSEVVIDQMANDAPIVPGSVSFTSVADDYEEQPLFKVEENTLSNSISIEGRFSQVGSNSEIPDDLIARLYFRDGLHTSSLVDSSTGLFTLVATEIPYGITPFLVSFVAESYDNNSVRGRRFLVEEEQAGLAKICMVKNLQSCGPPLTLTLTWNQPTSDVDLHVFEPGIDGKHVYYANPSGADGSFLDYDDTEGFGPEHYFAHSVSVGQDYRIQIVMYSYHQDTDVNVDWTLKAHSFDDLLWTRSGTFRQGETSSLSDFVTLSFDEEPICRDVSCDCCAEIGVQNERKLALINADCSSVVAPASWKPAREVTFQDGINEFYCKWNYKAINPLWTADLLNKAASCVVDYLTSAQKQSIIAGLGSARDLKTALEAADAVRAVFAAGRSNGTRICRHHALALVSVLEEIGYDASVEAAWSWAASPHTWAEAVIGGEQYILDCFNEVYIHVMKNPGCIYTRNSNTVGCSGDIYASSISYDFQCMTALPGEGYEYLPEGKYFIGDNTTYHPVKWYNLYAERSPGSIWDYHTLIPDKGCRGGFGFHAGSVSQGCVTVLAGNNNCFSKVKNFIETFPKNDRLSRFECRLCDEETGKCFWWNSGLRKISSIPLFDPVVLLSK